jgi:phage terminase small subunit
MPRTVKKDPNLQPGKPQKSPNLSPRASAEWDRIVSELDRSGIEVTPAHRTPLTLASTIAADIAEAWETIQKEGAYEVNSKTGTSQAHPASKRLDALRRDYIKVLVMLGLRNAVATAPHDTKQTLEDVLNG